MGVRALAGGDGLRVLVGGDVLRNLVGGGFLRPRLAGGQVPRGQFACGLRRSHRPRYSKRGVELLAYLLSIDIGCRLCVIADHEAALLLVVA